LLVLSIVLAVPALSAEVDWNRVKREWKSYSASEQAVYRELMERERLRQDPAGSSASRTPGDTCDDATHEIGSLPFTDDTGDTQGLTDDLNLATSGSCAGGGDQFLGTGTGPDIAYRVRVDTSCELAVQLTPTAPSSADLALYIVTDCANLAASCVRVSDGGLSGIPETITFVADPTSDYLVIVDGWNGAAGTYTLEITETGSAGCMLTPVRVQSFSID